MKQTTGTLTNLEGPNWVNMGEEEKRVFDIAIPYRATIFTMYHAGVFDPPKDHASQIILHYNAQGQLAKIDRNQILFVLTSK